MAKCFPSLEEIERFRVPLEPGERHLLDFLLHHLDDNYEIYVQPFLNGDRPDLIIVRQNSGVLVIEVKDWHLRNYLNPKGGLSSWKLCKNNGQIRSPLAQVETYKQHLYTLHINLLFERKIQNKKCFSIVQTAIYFHNETTKDAQSFCHSVNYTHILGYDALNTQDFNRLLEKAHLKHQSLMFDDDLYQSFRRFLRPPEHISDMGKDIQYTKRQQNLIQSQPKTRQKVRGLAGCGKTKVLAGRAVAAYSRTKERVLILTFNITLRNYIHDHLNEVRAPFPWSRFEITNYHQFFKTQANSYGVEYNDFLKAADEKDFFHPVKKDIQRYKTILVDEVQDYKTEWLRLLVNYFLAEDGEFVVFGDEKQNVYGRKMGEDSFPVIPSIPGRWNQLNQSFRMELTTLKIAQKFQDFYFKNLYELDSDLVRNQRNIFEEPAKFKYYEQPYNSDEIFQLIRNEIVLLNIHPNDLVVLAPTHEIIRALEYRFRHIAHENTTHAGETEEEYLSLLQKYNLENYEFPKENPDFKSKLQEIQRGRKLHFWPHAGTVKLSTIYSFKGWEAHSLVLVLSNVNSIDEQECLHELIYTAITRARKNLIIIDCNSLYSKFFSPIAKNFLEN
ncbi:MULTISPECIES: nuclease-related domain-containing DEAD/DEAH box helicase [unclassified Roseofilum]|uniref:nuclease-related domain-containing DEAD/DEAH box helicase n=1 Tax=unclassified Roseofilum TaxID=2620099 RepID=UPI000E92FEB6|nr:MULTISPECIES: NERD domain-containing protein [unclassified Roseofilum]MBP0008835.1 AAA family ATPase [Roseofilum sp. Belize Diploria]MBP0033134.1 AAA family ATPase [Roseofilum sp. Belize BBD 4]HBQ97817.1 hypothetical protein [Cyanobacteria bacterium UBA11691]